MKEKIKRIFTFFFLIVVLVFPLIVGAKSGCCSHHGGVCGCGCCDGTSLSATCAPYYPQCNKVVAPSVSEQTPTPTPEPILTSTTTSTPTPKITTVAPLKEEERAIVVQPEKQQIVERASLLATIGSIVTFGTGNILIGIIIFAIVIYAIYIIVYKKRKNSKKI